MRIFRRGNRWGVDYRAPGYPRTREIVGTKAQAELALSKIRTEIFEGRYFGQERRRAGMTLKECYEHWAKHAQLKPSFKADNQRFGVIVRYFGGERRIESISSSDVLDLRAWLLEQDTRKATRDRPSKNSPSTVNRYLTVMRTAMRLAVANGSIISSPVRGDQFLTEPPARDRICSPEEFTALIDGTELPHMRLAIVLGYESVMRLGEVMQMTWSRIDLKAGIFKLRKTKNQRPRDVPLSEDCIEELKAYRKIREADEETKGLDELFSVTMETMSSDFGDLTMRLGIKDLRYHDLRHTSATRLRRAGVDIVTLKRIGGWESWKAMERYQHVGHEDLREAVAKLKTSKK